MGAVSSTTRRSRGSTALLAVLLVSGLPETGGLRAAAAFPVMARTAPHGVALPCGRVGTPLLTPRPIVPALGLSFDAVHQLLESQLSNRKHMLQFGVIGAAIALWIIMRSRP